MEPCFKCLKMTKEAIIISCGHYICSNCFNIKENIMRCDSCLIICDCCKERTTQQIKFNCEHNGCDFCRNSFAICYPCLYNTKQNSGNYSGSCFICQGNKNVKNLMCGHFLCNTCAVNMKIENFNYYCIECCLKKQKTCIKCSQICMWEIIDEEYLHKICCNENYCLSCFKVISLLKPMLRCKCKKRSTKDTLYKYYKP